MPPHCEGGSSGEQDGSGPHRSWREYGAFTRLGVGEASTCRRGFPANTARSGLFASKPGIHRIHFDGAVCCCRGLTQTWCFACMNLRSAQHGLVMQTGSCRSARGSCALLATSAAITIGAVALFVPGTAESGTDITATRVASHLRNPAGLPPRPVILDHARLHPGSDPQAPCTCTTDRFYNGWCWHCNVGYIAGHQIRSPMLFETLDPHGHELDRDTLERICPDALRRDQWCEASAMGFVRGKTYFTRLTYGLAMGTPTDVPGLACEVCRAHGDDTPGWCESCRRGIVGNILLSDRALFDQTAQEYRNLFLAIEREPACQTCAQAMVAHTWCPKCKISYGWKPQCAP